MGKALVTASGCSGAVLEEGEMWMGGVRVLVDRGTMVSLLIWGSPVENCHV